MVQGSYGSLNEMTEEYKVTEEDIKEMEEFWEDPRNILNLIDLLFLDDDRRIPS